uniref:Iron-sulfur cluster biosynthesis n=1 Tax=Megaviridae environmental sample TaxID=1737588 RepID=A0A5J6VJE7_9VIRU|nr:MAG: iron-sulfur cluster biosynthesis [Megaviridae environmental sample]
MIYHGVSLSLNAAKQIKKIIPPNMNAIVLSIKSGGCNGFEYRLKPTVLHTQSDSFIFDKQHGVNFGVCKKSQLYLMGTTVNWEKSIMGSAFTFDNPLAKTQCGCNKSFGL